MRTNAHAPFLTLYHKRAFDEDWLDHSQWRLLANEQTYCDIGAHALRGALKESNVESRPAAAWIIPAEYVLITSVVVPSDKPQHIRAAVPNLLEEWTASEIYDLHIAYGQRSPNGELPVVALDRGFFTAQLAAIKAENIQCRHVFVDAQLLPWSVRTLTLLLDHRRALLRWSSQHCGAIELDALEPLLKALLETENIEHMRVLVSDSIDPAGKSFLQAALPRLQTNYGLALEQETLSCNVLEFLCNCLARNVDALDLRQGDFASIPDSSAAWKRWRPLAYTAGVLLTAQIIVQTGISLYLQHKAQTTHAAAEALYRDLFPNDKRLVNLQLQLQNQLGSLGDNRHRPFLELFGYLAQEIQRAPGDPPIQLLAMAYDAASGALQVDLNIANVRALDDLQKRLTARRLTVKVLSAAADEGGAFVGRISIAGG